MCKTLPRDISNENLLFGQDKKRTRPLTPRDKSAGDDLVKGIYERRFSNRVPPLPETIAEPTSSVEQRNESKGGLKGMDERRLNSERRPPCL